MEVGKHLVRIQDYGVSRTKAGGLMVFIDIGQMKWYGSPFKKDGELNEVCINQLAACGFDPVKNTIDQLSAGVESGILVTDEDIDCLVGTEVAPDGSDVLRIKWIGCSPINRLSDEETKALVTEEQKAKLAAVATKFKVRKKKNPGESLPF